jgi:hypothetical protein
LDLPETLVLEDLIQKERIKGIKQYAGKIDLDIDIARKRKR